INYKYKHKRRVLEISAASLLTPQLLPDFTQYIEPDKNRLYKRIYIVAQNPLPEESNRTLAEDALIAGLRGAGIKWDDIVKRAP
ncbi:hypothetical protein V2W45_1226310, partial [Cenococcum geophilum]